MKKLAHPMQPRKLDLNEIACMPFSAEDREQLAQLLGYSLCGFGELSYVRDSTYAKAESQSNALIAERRAKQRKAK